MLIPYLRPLGEISVLLVNLTLNLGQEVVVAGRMVVVVEGIGMEGSLSMCQVVWVVPCDVEDLLVEVVALGAMLVGT